MTPRRRDTDQDDDGVLAREARPIARLIRWAWAIGAALALFASGLYALDRTLARAAATEMVGTVVETRIAPLERWRDDHTIGLAGKREQMDRTVQLQTEALIKIDRKLNALCRASTRPQVCLGED